MMNLDIVLSLDNYFEQLNIGLYVFEKMTEASMCYQKIYRLQQNRRKQGRQKELYRPGEIVELNYFRDREAYRNKQIMPEKCMAFRIGETHLIRSKESNKNWRKLEEI